MSLTILLILVLIGIFSFGLYEVVFADRYDTISPVAELITGDPVVCVVEPHPDEKFPNLTEELFDATKKGLKNWETSFKETTGNEKSWNIYFNPIYNQDPSLSDLEDAVML